MSTGSLQALLQPNSAFAPRKRFRGQAKYYRRLFREAMTTPMLLAPNQWFSLWHYHADWDGYGNLGWRHRRAHLKAYFLFFKEMHRRLHTRGEPYQLWIYLNRKNSASDAVYVHTANPHVSFPFIPTSVQWGLDDVERHLERTFALPRLHAGKNEEAVFIYVPDVGEPLAP